jgi:long-chain acyl-CoA synthetase
MLYECWQKVVRERRNEIALRDLASRRCWTFSQLDAETDSPLPGHPAVIYPEGNSPEFIIAVLRAWRAHIVVCPLEAQHLPMAVVPPQKPCCHLKTTPASTSAVPHTVAFSPEQLAADAENIVTTMGLRSDWPNLGVISPAYSYGFSNLVLPLLLHGIPLYLVPSPMPVVLRSVAQAHKNLTVAAVPALWHAWHKAGAILGNVKLAISSGAPLPLTLERDVFEKHGLKIHNFYGTTECGGIAYDATMTPRTDESSVGCPLKNVKVKINGDGSLWVSSRATGETYWPKPEETLGRGVFQTADRAEIKNGEICLRGRTDDLINVAGRKVLPVIIEQTLQRHQDVTECVVFGVPSGSADRADIIVACVATNPAGTEDKLKQFLLLKLPAWQVPRLWWLLPSLGNNGNARSSRSQWRQKFLENRAQPNAAAGRDIFNRGGLCRWKSG